MARIMIAERDGQLAHRLQARLCEDGHKVTLFDESCPLAAELARTPPDLLVLGDRDYGRPPQDVVAGLKADPGTAPIAIVVIARDSDRTAMIQALRAGAADWVSKPLMPAELAWRVNAVLDPDHVEGAGSRRSAFA